MHDEDSARASGPATAGRSAIPAALRALPQWIVWRWEEDRENKREKRLIDPHTGGWASSTDRATWADFERAEASVPRWFADGVAFALTADLEIVGVDLDHVIDEAWHWSDRTQAILDTLRSYTELSPSGEGLHILVKGTLPPGGRKRAGVEMYDRDRFLTMTGWRLTDFPPTIEERTAELAALHEEVFARPEEPTRERAASDSTRSRSHFSDEAILRQARNARNGPKFVRLWAGEWEDEYPSQSEADLALIDLLAFWIGHDRARIARLFGESALGQRAKWRNRPDYQRRTIAKVLDDPHFTWWGTPKADSEPSAAGPGDATGSPDDRPGLGAVGAGDFLGQTFPPRTMLIDGLLSDEGGGFLGGEEKVGKTLYALHEALCLGLAAPVLWQFAVPAPHRVLFIEEEDSPRRTQYRLRALLGGLGRDPDDPTVRADLNAHFRLLVWSGFSLDDPIWIERLRGELDTFRPRVVYLDALRKLTVKELSKTFDAGPLLAILDTLRRAHGVIFRVVHHYRKVQAGGRTGRGSQEVAGSYQLGAWAENSLFFEPIARRQGPVKVAIQTKDLAPSPPFKLVIESEGPAEAPTHLRLRAEPLGDSDPREQHRQAVLDHLRTLMPRTGEDGAQGVTADDVTAAMKLALVTVRMMLRDLEARHLARRTGVWRRDAGRGARDVTLWAATEGGGA